MARARRLVALASINLMLAGCAMGPRAIERPDPQVALPDRWIGLGSAPVTGDMARYWTVLGDPLIDDLVARALSENRTMVQAAARLAQARAGVAQARAGYLPQVGASGSASRDLGKGASDKVRLGLGTDVRWETDLFGRVSLGVAASEADLAGAGYSLADLQRGIVGQIAQGVISGRSLAQQLAIARDTVRIQQDNLQIARWRLQAGLVTSLDVEQARAQLAETSASIPSLERELAATAHGLSRLAGEAPGRVLGELSDPRPIPRAGQAFEGDIPAAMLRRRPDVRLAETQLAADLARLGLARTQYLPTLQLSGSINTSALGLGSLFTTITGGLLGSVSQLIFDAGRTRAQVASARAQAQASAAGWEQAILIALEEVESSAAALTAARERMAFTRISLEAAQNTALLARSQYQAGLIDFQRLLTAESTLLAARNAVIAGEAEEAAAFVRLTQALGGGWDPAQPLETYDALLSER